MVRQAAEEEEECIWNPSLLTYLVELEHQPLWPAPTLSQLAIWDRTLSPHTLKAAIIDRSWDFMICMLYGLRTYVGTHIIQHIIEPYFISRVYFFNFSCLFHCKSQHRGGDGHQVQRQPNLWRPTPLQLHPPLWRPDLTKMTNYMPSKIFMSSTHRSSTDHIIDL
jgi:hypothetical protein